MDELTFELREAMQKIRIPAFCYSMDGSMCFDANDPKRTIYRRVCTDAGETWVPVPEYPSADLTPR